MIGYIRAGARAVRSVEPYDGKDAVSCGGKWYKLEPAGFVCAGKDGVTLDLDDAIVIAAAKFPPRAAPLPYGYGMSQGAQTYARVPTPDEQKATEGDVAAWRKLVADTRAKTPPEKLWPETALPVDPMPSFIENHAQVPATMPWLAIQKPLRAGFIQHGTRLAFLTAFESDGRSFYLTTEHVVVPADRIKAAGLSAFHGVDLAAAGQMGEHLPMVWARYPVETKIIPSVYKIAGDVVTKTDVAMAYQSHAEVAEADITIKGAKYHELLSPLAISAALTPESGVKYAVKAGEATRLDAAPAASRPEKIAANELWIEVSLYKQTLVIYQGAVPTFATLVSTGAGGKTKNTPWGAFRVYQKHVTSRMSAEEKPAEKEGDEAEHAYRYDDVPYVQYLVGGIAIHAAFWHEGFGMPRSHGCINLSPRDAQYVFGKTLPAMPQGWHGINPGRAGLPVGSLVVIHG